MFNNNIYIIYLYMSVFIGRFGFMNSIVSILKEDYINSSEIERVLGYSKGYLRNYTRNDSKVKEMPESVFDSVKILFLNLLELLDKYGDESGYKHVFKNKVIIWSMLLPKNANNALYFYYKLGRNFPSKHNLKYSESIKIVKERIQIIK